LQLLDLLGSEQVAVADSVKEMLEGRGRLHRRAMTRAASARAALYAKQDGNFFFDAFAFQRIHARACRRHAVAQAAARSSSEPERIVLVVIGNRVEERS
jgi:hypothetical protein